MSPTNFTAASPTLIDVCAMSEPDSIQMFSQISLPEMNTDHDHIYGACKNCEDDNETIHQEPEIFRNYNRFDMEQLKSDIYAQTWNALYGMADPEDQIQYFNAIIIWLCWSCTRRYFADI
jgi:hypothetical protein